MALLGARPSARSFNRQTHPLGLDEADVTAPPGDQTRLNPQSLLESGDALGPDLRHSLDPRIGSDVAGGYKALSVPGDLHPDGLEAAGDIL